MAEMELFRALAVLAEPPTVEAARLTEALELGAPPAADDYTELFLFQLYPHASVYLGREGMMGGEAVALIAGFWRNLGQVPPAEADHLALMLALYARLAEMEEQESEPVRRASLRALRKAFLWEHLLSWLPCYLSKLSDIATPFYKRWGEILMTALLEEAQGLGQQQRLPLALREAPALAHPREQGFEEFLQSVLTPVRFGGILTRADLIRAARKMGLGLRMGERKFILKTLFAQERDAVFAWLEEETVDWKRRHHQHRERLGEVSGAWEEKTVASAALLAELRLTASEVV
jgi:TorA maturation chaperone TorD